MSVRAEAGRRGAAAGGDDDPRGDFDQPHAPRAGVTLVQRIGFAAAIEVAAAVKWCRRRPSLT